MDRDHLIFHKGRIHALINSAINVSLSFTQDRRDSISRNLHKAYEALKKADDAIDVKLKKLETSAPVKKTRKSSKK